ncbi:hypothetical protein J132_04264, partial [Termitomyces sp. J132]
GELPPGWKQLTHPEGQPYFYHSGKRIITECWLWDPQMFKNLNCFIDRFEEFTQERNLTQRGDVDLLLEVNRNLTKRGDVGLLLEVNVEDEISWCGYYYVWASTRTVFWLEHFDLSSHVPELKGHVSSTYTKAYLEYQYWYHWNLFPNIHDVDDDIYDLVANTIADARTDVHTSRSSTVTLTKEQLKEMAEIVEGMKTKARYQNYYGQYGARLDYEQSVYSNKPPEETLLFKIFSPLLFFAPNVSLKSLNEVWVDGITIRARCLDFFFQMNIQWRGHIVHASILLNANVAFLAIPSNDPSNNTLTLQSNRTGAQIISYLSIVTSLASMLLASMLVRKHSSKQYDSLYDYTFVSFMSVLMAEVHSLNQSKYLDTHHHPKYGFEALAIIYSLPYVLLMWGMATFLVAFLLMCLVISTSTVRFIVAIATSFNLGLVLLFVWVFREESYKNWQKDLRNMWWDWLTGQRGREDSSTSNQYDSPHETEPRLNNTEANQRSDSGRDAASAEQNTRRKGFHSLLKCVKCWWGERWGAARLRGNAPSSAGRSIPLSDV